MASHFNCSAAISTLACLRAIPATSIKRYIEANEIDFAPIDGDGTHTKNIHDSITTGRYAHVPIIMGSNANEGTVFLSILGLNNGTRIVEALVNRIGPSLGSLIPYAFRDYMSRAIDGIYHFSDQ